VEQERADRVLWLAQVERDQQTQLREHQSATQEAEAEAHTVLERHHPHRQVAVQAERTQVLDQTHRLPTLEAEAVEQARLARLLQETEHLELSSLLIQMVTMR
jgi:hypothetical protein